MRYRFSDYVLDIDRRELTRGSERVPIGPQVFDLLVHLVANRGSQPLVSLHLYGFSADRLTTGINRYF